MNVVCTRTRIQPTAYTQTHTHTHAHKHARARTQPASPTPTPAHTRAHTHTHTNAPRAGANIHETREWVMRNSPVPVGTVPSPTGTSLPVGLQILAPHLGEPAILRVARAAELACPQ